MNEYDWKRDSRERDRPSGYDADIHEEDVDDFSNVPPPSPGQEDPGYGLESGADWQRRGER